MAVKFSSKNRIYLPGELMQIYPINCHWTCVYKIYELITANDLEGIRSQLDELTLRNRQSIAVSKAFNNILLRYACEVGFRDIVKYLLDECALDISDRYYYHFMWASPLRVSIYNLDLSIVLLLISRGAVVVAKIETETGSDHEFNISNFSMQSIFSCCTHGTSELLPVLSWIKNMALDQDVHAILRATARGEIEEMKIVQSYGIKGEKNFSYNNALCIAILNRRSDAENHLLNCGIFTLKDHVRALELCGAIFIAYRSDIEQGLLCWKKSIRIRKENFFGTSDKFFNKTKIDLGVEFTCEKELDMMANSEAELNIQALIVLVRLLPPNNKFLHVNFVNVAQKRVFQNNLLQALKVLAALSEFPNVPDSEDEGPVGESDSEDEGPVGESDSEDEGPVGESDSEGEGPVRESGRELEYLLHVAFSHDPTDISELLLRFQSFFDALNWFDWKVLIKKNIHFYCTLYNDLLKLLTKNIIDMHKFGLCRNDKAWIKDGVSGIMQLLGDGYTTLLHTAIDHVATLPAIAFIVSCTTDANCIDNDKQTPMHAAAELEDDESYILHLVNLLADAGGHIDSMDRYNTTPYLLLQEKDIIINPIKFLSLQCLAAQTIHKHNIEIPEIYPKILVSFLKLHSNVTV